MVSYDYYISACTNEMYWYRNRKSILNVISYPPILIPYDFTINVY